MKDILFSFTDSKPSIALLIAVYSSYKIAFIVAPILSASDADEWFSIPFIISAAVKLTVPTKLLASSTFYA
jgi:hypothetical protein